MDEFNESLKQLLEAAKGLKTQVRATNKAMEDLVRSSHVQSVMTIFREGEAKRV